MKHRLILPTLCLAFVALATTSSPAAESAKPSADELLKQMSTKLAAAKQFSFKAQRETDAVLVPGRTTV